jgi:membrane protease YdiL (CAAX protease family)
MTTMEFAMESSRDEGSVPQYKPWQIVAMLVWPVLWWLFLFHVIVPLFLLDDNGEISTWAALSVASLGYLAELIGALVVLRREGYRLTLKALKERINWRWVRGWKNWGLVVVLVVVGFGLATFTSKYERALAMVPGFIPPDWMPADQHPLKEVTGLEDALPGIALAGNFAFLAFFLLNGTLNIIGEDLYWRGALQPKLEGVFGKWAWLAGGTMFFLKHFYVRWRYPGIWTLGPVGAYIFGPLGSLPVVMLVHFITNFGLTWPLVIQAVLSGG